LNLKGYLQDEIGMKANRFISDLEQVVGI